MPLDVLVLRRDRSDGHDALLAGGSGNGVEAAEARYVEYHCVAGDM